MSGWSCPHESDGVCRRLKKPCHPGQKGCVLKGKFVFASDDDSVGLSETKIEAVREIAPRNKVVTKRIQKTKNDGAHHRKTK